jgi:hypothetical protein
MSDRRPEIKIAGSGTIRKHHRSMDRRRTMWVVRRPEALPISPLGRDSMIDRKGRQEIG